MHIKSFTLIDYFSLDERMLLLTALSGLASDITASIDNYGHCFTQDNLEKLKLELDDVYKLRTIVFDSINFVK